MRAKSELRSYQQRAVEWLYERDAAIAVLDLGAGKTAIALTAIGEMVEKGVVRHALVVAPKRVAELTWPAEIAAWEHTSGLKAAVLTGTAVERARLLACASTRQLTIIGIDNAQWLVEELKKLPGGHPLFDLLVIDEASRLKSPRSKRAKALLSQADRFGARWGMTGTPRPNSAMDLFMPAAVITANKLWGRSFVRWQRQRFRVVDPFGREWSIRDEWVEPTNREFASIAITLDEGDMPDLPDLNVIVDPINLPPEIWDAYRRMQRTLIAEVQGVEVAAASQAIATGKLAQMVSGFVYGDDLSDVTHLHDAKLEWLDEIVETLDGNPLLVAYEFVEDARRLRARYRCPVIGGETTAGDAARAFQDWNGGKLPMLAIHPASAGHGLNLQHGGSHLAWLGLTWSAELYEQTIKRIHRPGQTRHVTIHIPLVLSSVDELKRDRVINKLSKQAAFRNFLAKV